MEKPLIFKLSIASGALALVLVGTFWLFKDSLITCENCLAATITGINKQESMETNSLLVDVRTPAEYQAGFRTGAINIPMEEILAGNLGVISNTDKEALIEMYCVSGRRAEIAREVLTELGYTNVVNLHEDATYN